MRAILNTATRTALEIFDGTVPRPLAAFEAVVAVLDDPATFNAATHNRVLTSTEITGAKVIRHWTVTEKPQQQIYDEHLAAGYLDATTGIKLKATEHAQAKFGQLVTLLSLALNTGAVQATTEHTIFDYEDAEQTLPISDLLALLLRYGFFCATLHRDYAP